MAEPEAHSDAAEAAAIFTIAGVFLAWTCLPGPHWHDTAEFAATSWRLSLSHPPGHPAHALVSKAAQLLPFGDGGFRANLASALALAAALAIFYRLLRGLAADLGRLPTASLALLPAVMPALWVQGARAEVYALQILLGVAVFECGRRLTQGDRRALPAMALAFGLAGANHSFIGLLWIPFALCLIAVARPGWRAFWQAAGAGALGLSTYLYLPLRAHAGGEIGWGVPNTLHRVWVIISAQEWQKSLAAEHRDFELLDRVADLVVYVITQLGGVGALLLLALLALGTARLVRARSWPALLLVGLVALPFVVRGLLVYVFDPAVPDVGGYLATGLFALLALAALAGAQLGPARWALPLVLLFAAPHYDPGQRAGARSAPALARALFAETPPDGVIVTSDFASHFLLSYLRAVEGARPDLALVFRGQVRSDWQRERLARQSPRVAERLPNFPKGFTGPEVRYEPGVHFERLGPMAARLRAVGVSLAVDGVSSVPRQSAAFEALQGADLDALRSHAFLHLQHVDHALRIGDLELARWHLVQADALAPGDPSIAARLKALRP